MLFLQMIVKMIVREPPGRALSLMQTSGFDYLYASYTRLGRRRNVLITEALLALVFFLGYHT
jgi:hypothetical protein